MIKYALLCNNGHEFEAWFSSSGEYDRLRQSGHLHCAHCNSENIEKQLMAPSVSTSKKTLKTQIMDEVVAVKPQSNTPASVVPSNPENNVPMASDAPTALVAGPAIPAEIQQQFAREMRKLRKKIIDNAENVGEKFSEEARKMHYGETKKRSIYGKASIKEASELWEEGVEFAALPELPEDRN